MQASPACSLCVAPAAGGFLSELFSADFVPRAQCVGDRAEIIWLHVLSDGVIALAYFSIPLALAHFVRRRRDVAFPGVFWLFAAFILACGATHGFGVAAFWYPMYRLDGLVKALTAGLSITTAAVLWRLLPRALSLPGPSELARLNAELRDEVAERRRAEARLESARGGLESRVAERTGELAEANRRLAAGLAEKEVAEEALKESRQRLQQKLAEIESLYSGAPVGLCFVDCEARLVRANAMLADIAGATVRDGVGRPIGDALAGTGALLEAECRRVIESGKGSAERLLRVTVGPSRRERRWLLSSGPVRDEDGTLLGVNVLVQDVTERQLMEERLRQSQKTEAVGQLAAGIAHEINNSLTAIYGYLSLARAQVPAAHAATDHLDRVLMAAEQAGHITKALLTFSRNDPAARSPVELRLVVEQAITLFSGLTPASIRVEAETAEAEGLMVRGDSTQLQQVVLNLAINARDAMPQGGTLRVRVGTGPREGGEEGLGFVRLTIQDTGVGMTREVRDRVFEPFFTTKARGHGTGLGTSVVHGIVTSHGGEIEVESSPNRGTTFTIDLPRCAGTGPASRAGSAGENGERAAGTVVLAEDNRSIRELLARSLREAGFTVLEAKDGQELLDRVMAMEISGAAIAALVLDVDMPVRSGVECLRLLRGRGQMAPVVMITGGPAGEAEREPRTRVLRKPFHMRDLVAAVREAVAMARAGAGNGPRV
ncbi:MAG: PAS domain-containing protein [Phycisphaerales bacterium]|nr:PAS domain-containing protein [Phycisphaerales bacterium]